MCRMFSASTWSDRLLVFMARSIRLRESHTANYFFTSFPQGNCVRGVPMDSLEDTVATVTTSERQRALP